MRPGIDIDNIQFDVPFDTSMIDGIFSGYSGIGQWTASKLSEFTKDKLYPIDLRGGESLELSDNTFGLGYHIKSANRVVSSRREINICYSVPEGMLALLIPGF